MQKKEFIFFFNDTATTEIYTLSLHDALPICSVFESTSSYPDNVDFEYDPETGDIISIKEYNFED